MRRSVTAVYAVIVCLSMKVNFISTGDFDEDFYLQTDDILINWRRRFILWVVWGCSDAPGSYTARVRVSFNRIRGSPIMHYTNSYYITSVFVCMSPVDLICRYVCVSITRRYRIKRLNLGLCKQHHKIAQGWGYLVTSLELIRWQKWYRDHENTYTS